MLTELSNNKFRKHQKTKTPLIMSLPDSTVLRPKSCYNLQVTIIAQIKRKPHSSLVKYVINATSQWITEIGAVIVCSNVRVVPACAYAL